MTIKNLYPPSRPALIYNVINGRPELPVSSAFSRASTATYINSRGQLQVADSGDPRFTHDPDTNEFLGLLVEKEGRNLYEAWNQTISPAQAFQGMMKVDENILLPTGAIGAARRWKVNPGQALSYGTARWKSQGQQAPDGGSYTASFWIKSASAAGNQATMWISGYQYVQVNCTDEWQRASIVAQPSPEISGGLFVDLYIDNGGGPSKEYYIWGMQIEKASAASTYILSTTSDTRAADSFKLEAVRNFDPGFSLLLDSETTTDDFLYKINASGTEIASLSNSGGTLDWEINGKSAAVNGSYPQVGFVKGRVRTISSFTAAGDAINPNYLYTTGLSFPTVGAPAAGADELEFGTPQILKAVYVWDGQLDPVQAVSIIKGDTNIVPSNPIDGTKYSFVYNTDPENNGNVNIKLPYITPTNVSGGMTIDWGDGTPIATYNKGVVPAHSYPYPGQYRIQVSGNETWSPAGDITGTLLSGGFDRVTLADVASSITLVDQWPPQFRTTAAGVGFTGTDLAYMFDNQTTLPSIPDIKYDGNLTSINNYTNRCFSIGKSLGTGWIPIELPKCTQAQYVFGYLGAGLNKADRFTELPQLQTSALLENVYGIYYQSGVNKWRDKGNVVTNKPFTDSSGIKNLGAAFALCELTDFYAGFDCTSLTACQNAWNNNLFTTFPLLTFPNSFTCVGAWRQNSELVTFPKIDFTNAYDITATWADCVKLETFTSDTFANVVDASSAWSGCVKMTSFPAQANNSWKKCYYFNNTWQQCRALTSFPDLDIPEALGLEYAFYSCNGLTDFPKLTSTSKVTNWNYAFTAIDDPTSWPDTDTSAGTSFVQTWYACYGLTSFQETDMSKATNLNAAWSSCTALANFATFKDAFLPKKNVNISRTWYNTAIVSMPAFTYEKITYAKQAWKACQYMTTFPPNQFNTTGVLQANAFDEAFTNCALEDTGPNPSISYILQSLDANGATGIKLGLDGGTTADYKDWSANAKTAFASLAKPIADGGKGWDIDVNDSTNVAPYSMSAKSGFYVNHEDGNIAFGELKPGVTHSSGKASQEVFEGEEKAVARVLELDENFFPAWNREEAYFPGDRVKIGQRIYRALQESDVRTFGLEPIDTGIPENLEVELATPQTRDAHWVEVYEPEEEDLFAEAMASEE